MPRGEPGIDEGLEVFSNRFAALPIRNAEIADRILGEAVKTLAEGFVVNLLPHVEQPLRRFRFRKSDLLLLGKSDIHVSLLDFLDVEQRLALARA